MPSHQVQLTELVKHDIDSEKQFSRATDKDEQKRFEFSDRDLTTDTDNDETEITYDGQYDTQTSKNTDLSPCELVRQLNVFIDKHLSKAENQLKNAKKLGLRS